jgi:hypothetical protein
LRDRPAVDFAGTVIDAERAHLAKDAGDDRSSVMPSPPSTCIEQSTMRQIAS